MAKVFLIQAAVHDQHIERAQPLGLMYIAAYLQRHRGDEVRLHDMRLDWRNYQSPLETLRTFQPDVVGISAHGLDAPAMHRLAELIKKETPTIPVVCGGVHGTAYWREILADQHLDAVVIGEGERTFAELLDAFDKRCSPAEVDGIAYRTGQEVQHRAPRTYQEPLDDFGFPAWSLLDIDAYGRFPRIGLIYRDKRYMSIETARGCPFHCAWCHNTMGRQFRPRSAEHVVEMITTLVNHYRIRDILVIDDLFNFDRGRVKEIFTSLLRKQLPVSFALPNGVRADLLDEETIALMRRAGVYRMMIAVETASPRLQKDMGKNLDLEHARTMIDYASRLGISVHGNFIIGLPTESEAEMRQTIRFAVRSRLDTFGLYRAIPFKDTHLFEMARQAGFQQATGEMVYSFWDQTQNISPIPLPTINRARRWAYPQFYLRPKRLWRLVRHLPNKARLLPFLFWFFLKKSYSGRDR